MTLSPFQKLWLPWYAGTHDTLLCFTSTGKLFWLRTFELPHGGRASRGKPIVNLLPKLQDDEKITAILPMAKDMEGQYVFMATSNGTVKKVDLDAFSRPRAAGLIAIELEEGNRLVNVAITNGEQDIVLVANSGKAIRFKESDVRAMGRNARGVRGMRLQQGQQVIALMVPEEGGQVLTASEHGYGKRTDISEYPLRGRGGQGVIAMVTDERNGELVGATQVFGNEDIMLISNMGTLVRTRVDEVSVLSRNTKGVRLIRLGDGEKLVGVEPIPELDEEDVDEEGTAEEEGATEEKGEQASDEQEGSEPSED